MIKPLIIVSKIDLLTNIELDELNKKIEYYRSIGYEIICVNSKTKENIELILPYLENKITVLAGQTGAGKSTLINALIPGFDLKTQEISMALGRGKHTTREIKLYEFNSALIGDTPGFSKFDIMDIKPCDLSKYYIEFKAYDCKFNDCLHKPNILGCNVTKALNDGKILKERYENYLKILNDISSDRKR